MRQIYRGATPRSSTYYTSTSSHLERRDECEVLNPDRDGTWVGKASGLISSVAENTRAATAVSATSNLNRNVCNVQI